MRKYCRVACFILLLGSILFGILYPLTIWTVAHLLFPYRAEGSPLVINNTIVGFEKIGQHFSSDKYFFSRPEVGLNEVSGGSNLSWTSKTLRKKVSSRIDLFPQKNIASLPADLLMESASGFDPHISLKAAFIQVERIARARNISEKELFDLIVANKEVHLLGLFPDCVNVLLLNKELDRLFQS